MSGPAAGTRGVQSRQGGSSSPTAGTDGQEPSSEQQQQLDAMLARLPEVPYAELPLGATIAHREGHMVGG